MNFNAYNYDLKSKLKQHKVLAIITAILFLALGVLMILLPFVTTVVLIWILIGLVGVGALTMIVRFIVGKPKRNPAEFILGILLALLVAGIIVGGVLSAQNGTFEEVSTRMLYFLGIFFGVFLLCEGIYSLCCIGSVIPEMKGWAICNGILSIVIGGLVFAFPLAGVGAYTIISGVYLIVIAIGLIVGVCAANKAAKANKKNDAEKADIDEK